MPRRKRRRTEPLKISLVVSVEDRINSLKSDTEEQQQSFLENGGWGLLRDWIATSQGNGALLRSILNLIIELPTSSVLSMLDKSDASILSSLQSIGTRKEPDEQIGRETRQLCRDVLLKWHDLIKDNNRQEETGAVLVTGTPHIINPPEKSDTDSSSESSPTTATTKSGAVEGQPVTNTHDDEKEKNGDNSNCRQTTVLDTSSTVKGKVTSKPRGKRISKDEVEEDEVLKKVIKKVKKEVKMRKESIRKCKLLENDKHVLFRKRRVTGAGADERLEDVTLSAEEKDSKKTVSKRINKVNAYFSETNRTEGIVKIMEGTVPVYPQRAVARISPTQKLISVTTQKNSLVTSSTQTVPVIVFQKATLTAKAPLLSLPSTTNEPALSTTSCQTPLSVLTHTTQSAPAPSKEPSLLTALTSTSSQTDKPIQPPSTSKELVLWKPVPSQFLPRPLLMRGRPPPPVVRAAGLLVTASTQSTETTCSHSQEPEILKNVIPTKINGIPTLGGNESVWRLYKINADEKISKRSRSNRHCHIKSYEKEIQEKREQRVSLMHPSQPSVFSIMESSADESDLDSGCCFSQFVTRKVPQKNTGRTKIRDYSRKSWPLPKPNGNVMVIPCLQQSLGKETVELLDLTLSPENESPCKNPINNYTSFIPAFHSLISVPDHAPHIPTRCSTLPRHPATATPPASAATNIWPPLPLPPQHSSIFTPRPPPDGRSREGIGFPSSLSPSVFPHRHHYHQPTLLPFGASAPTGSEFWNCDSLLNLSNSLLFDRTHHHHQIPGPDPTAWE